MEEETQDYPLEVVPDEEFGAAPERKPEDETARPAQEPAVNLDRFEQRLNDIAGAVSRMTRDGEVRQVREQVARREAELSQAHARAERAVEEAQRRLSQAFDDQDPEQMSRLQRELGEAIAQRERHKGTLEEHRQAVRQLERRVQQQGGQQQQSSSDDDLDTTNLEHWKSRNSQWYGVDAEMTKAAHAIDQSIREAGVIPVGSQTYFEAIDRQMAQQFPDKFRRGPSTGSGHSQQGSGKAQGRVPMSVVDGWRRMGINVDDPAVAKRMIKNRETAVRKGLLPETPAYGPVRTR